MPAEAKQFCREKARRYSIRMLDTEYLAELDNPQLSVALQNHFVPAELQEGTYDEIYELYLGDRATAILELINGEKKLFEEVVGKAVVATTPV